ncbi:unnamed protein product [Cuscuta europaea]|nr:unnamed protein product [Cuscuta europaea]
MKDVVKKEVIKLLDAGIIYPISDSRWVCPIHVVPKKGGFTVVPNEHNELIPTRLVTGWRMCIDYRKLNKVTNKDHYPLPFIDQLLERMANHSHYCFLDGFSGYFQIMIHPDDQEKTTFTCAYGTFAFRRMSFGLCNAPGTFQRCMMAIFSDLIEEIMEVFMDDFSVYGTSFDSCLDNLDKALSRCQEANLVLNWEKCHFMVTEGIVLGHKISSKGIEVDPAKIEVIEKLPPPTSVKGIRSFLGHAGFYRRFIKDFANIAKPLTRLLSKEVEFIFDDACLNSFCKIKKALCSAPVIQPPDWSMPFILMCDASDYAVGAMLGQKQGRCIHAIYYACHTLDDAQQNYATTEKELLAVVFAIEKFRSYLVGSKVIVYTDHSTLSTCLQRRRPSHDLLDGCCYCKSLTSRSLTKRGLKMSSLITCPELSHTQKKKRPKNYPLMIHSRENICSLSSTFLLGMLIGLITWSVVIFLPNSRGPKRKSSYMMLALIFGMNHYCSRDVLMELFEDAFQKMSLRLSFIIVIHHHMVVISDPQGRQLKSYSQVSIGLHCSKILKCT